MDESIVQGVLGAELAIRHCIVIILEFSNKFCFICRVLYCFFSSNTICCAFSVHLLHGRLVDLLQICCTNPRQIEVIGLRAKARSQP